MNQFHIWSSKMYEWYAGLPWYWKVIGFLALFLIGLLTVIGILLDVGREGLDTSHSDAAETTIVNDAVKKDQQEEAARVQEIAKVKDEAAAILKEKADMNARSEGIKKKIDNATSVEEVNRILKEEGL